MKFVAAACITLSLCVTACSPEAQDYVEHPEGKPALTKEAFITSDGVSLPMRHWIPKTKPKAIIVGLHGFNDYSWSFASTGQFFEKHLVALYAYDQRGFGKAPGTGLWASKENLVRDLSQLVNLLKTRYPNTPLFILGESMGGAVVIDALADPDFPEVDGAILAAPAVWGAETMNPFFRAVLWTGAHTFPSKQLTGSELKILASNNIPMLRRMGLDPLVIKATRIDAIYGLVQLMDSAYSNVPKDKTPTLLLYGARDQVIPKEPIENSIARFSEPVEFAYYPEGFHMLLRDIQGEQVMRDILYWILHEDAKLPSGFGREYVRKNDKSLKRSE